MSYMGAGADIASSSAEVIAQSRILPPSITAVAAESIIHDWHASTRIVMLQLDSYAAKGATSIAMEFVPRALLTSAQNIGRTVITGQPCRFMKPCCWRPMNSRPFPMFMTSAGTVKPAKLVILDVISHPLQDDCDGEAFGCSESKPSDLHPTAREQVESLGGKWLDVPMSAEEAETAKSTR